MEQGPRPIRESSSYFSFVGQGSTDVAERSSRSPFANRLVAVYPAHDEQTAHHGEFLVYLEHPGLATPRHGLQPAKYLALALYAGDSPTSAGARLLDIYQGFYNAISPEANYLFMHCGSIFMLILSKRP